MFKVLYSIVLHPVHSSHQIFMAVHQSSTYEYFAGYTNFVS